MELTEVIKLAERFAKCEECGSEKVGNGEGTLVVDDDFFMRSCKCGWEIKAYKNKQKGEM